MVKDAPNVQDILTSPDTVDVPDASQSNIRYAVSSALTKMVKSEQDFENALTYLARFNSPEYEVFTTKLIVSKNPNFMETKTYSSFTLRNKI